MASVCDRCALRIYRAVVRTEAPSTYTRAFSSGARRNAGIPTFKESTNPELNNVLASMRKYYFVPAWLKDEQRRMIYKAKHKQQLEDSPQIVTIGGEEIQLQWVDRQREVPSRTRLLTQAVDMMAEEGDKDWDNLPRILAGLKRCKAVPNEQHMQRIIRLATVSGRFNVILQCLRSADENGMTMSRRDVLVGVLRGIRSTAERSGWSQEGIEKALREANTVALQLESENHFGGKLSAHDARRSPEVIGLFLELTSVHAWKYQDRKDTNGMVKAYAERLLANIQTPGDLLPKELKSVGPQTDFLLCVPIWHGLVLAEKMLATQMPNTVTAKNIIAEYAAALAPLAQALESRSPGEETYDGQALKTWRECIRV